MLKSDLKTFLHQQNLDLYERHTSSLCVGNLQEIVTLSQMLVSQWAGLSAAFHKFCKETLLGELQGDRNEHFRRGDNLVIDQVIDDAVNPYSIVLEQKNGRHTIKGVYGKEDRGRVKLSKVLTRDIFTLLFKSPDSLEGLYLFLREYTAVNTLSKVEVDRVHNELFNFSIEGEGDLPDIIRELDFTAEEIELFLEWEYREQAEFIKSFLYYSAGLSIYDEDLRIADSGESREKYKAIFPERRADDTYHFQLGVEVEELARDNAFATAEEFTHTLENMLDKAGKHYGIGGYMEVRPFYTTPAYQKESWIGSRWRTMHLGVDIWCDAGEIVCAPLKCEVFSAHDNDIKGDYGPTIILKVLDTHDELYLLYGHMSRESLSPLEKGDIIEAGDVVGRIGTAQENGGWPPHLHFQLIRSMFHYKYNFNGLCDPQFQDYWREICPSPYAFLDIDLESEQGDRSLTDSELQFIRYDGSKLYTSNGQRYLDFKPGERKYGYHRDPYPVDEVQRVDREIERILREEEFRVLDCDRKSLLQWELSFKSDMECATMESNELYTRLNSLLMNGKVIAEKRTAGVWIQFPHCIEEEELRYFISVLHRIEDLYFT